MSQARTSFSELPAGIKAILDIVQLRYIADTSGIEDDKELAPYTEIAGEEDLKHSPERYDRNAARIVDFYLLKVPIMVDEIIRDNYHQWGGTARTIAAVTQRTATYINPSARYLDATYFIPHIFSPQMYKKMQWLEWLLTKLKEQEQGLSVIIKPLFKAFIDKRLPPTIARLNEYAKQHSIARIPVEEFIESLTQLQASAASSTLLPDSAIPTSTVFLGSGEVREVKASALVPPDALLSIFVLWMIATQHEPSIGARRTAQTTLSLVAESDRDNPPQILERKSLPRTSTALILLPTSSTISPAMMLWILYVASRPQIETPPQIRLRDPASITVIADSESKSSEASPASYVADAKEHTLELAKQNIFRVIRCHIPTIGRYSPDLFSRPAKRRAETLMAKVQQSTSLDGLKDIIAQFIFTGQADSDSFFQRSLTINKTTLRSMLGDAFCPAFFQNCAHVFSPRLFSNAARIKALLDLTPREEVLTLATTKRT